MPKIAQSLGGSLAAHIEYRDGGTSVALFGKVTEAADFSKLTALRTALWVDLSAVENINSLGVRAWCNFVRDCERAKQPLVIEKMAPVMVQQMSMISSFMGTHAQVKSIFVPYLCPSCNAEDLRLVELTSRDAPVTVPSNVLCPKCKTPMQVDELDGMYENLFGTTAAR
ncbi:MAG: hypothetical protein H0T89_00540 [Deltaproteobacteria bacterium]|nr:hypothetical protein [Deltaproteobacteria bacterium]MDQ3299432.1 hypothetical protein [Myxococcota bacterium]